MMFRDTNAVVRHLKRPYLPFLLSLLLFVAACTSPALTASNPATPTVGAGPTATEAAPTQIPVEEATIASASGLGTVAFVRDGLLYIQVGDAEPVAVEDCSGDRCLIYHLRWSPAADLLLYYLGSYDGSVPNQIRVADLTGAAQTITEQAAYVQPAGWAWDGRAIAYRTDTDRHAELTDGPMARIEELWTVTVAEDGALGEAELRGEVEFGEGCGGGGRSESANVYEREGGFAYGYLSGVMAWSADDILLYTDNCSTRGVSRFDLANNVPLEPYTGGLRSLSLNGTGDAWVAINEENAIVTGTPGSLETTVIASSDAPELVTFGQHTGTIYYTTLQITGAADLVEQASATLDQSIMLFPYFDTTEASLVALDPAAGEETVLYSGDGYAYARIQERAGGAILFSRIEDNAELQEAVENQSLTAENWRDYLPTVDVLQVGEGSDAEVILADAAQFTLAGQ